MPSPRGYLNASCWDFPGGPVGRTPTLNEGDLDWPLVRELDPTCHDEGLAQPNKDNLKKINLAVKYWQVLIFFPIKLDLCSPVYTESSNILDFVGPTWCISQSSQQLNIQEVYDANLYFVIILKNLKCITATLGLRCCAQARCLWGGGSHSPGGAWCGISTLSWDS